jgi:hypothetical protein
MTERDITTAEELKKYLEESNGVLVVDFHATYTHIYADGAARASSLHRQYMTLRRNTASMLQGSMSIRLTT